MKFKFLITFLVGIVILSPFVVRADEFSQLQQQIFSLIQQITRLQSDLDSLQRISNLPCFTLTRNLRVGDSGDDVAFLQVSLEKEGFGVVGTEKSQKTFSDLTASAVSGFQQKYKAEILTPVGLEYGTGFAGKATVAKLNSIYGCGAKAPDIGQRQPVRSAKQITVLDPVGGAVVGTPLHVSGYVNSDGWVIGKSNAGTVSLVTTLGRVLGQTSLSVKSDVNRMPIAFEGTISFPSPQIDTGVLVFSSQNSSTFLSKAEKEFRVPVKFSPKSKNIVVRSPRMGAQLVAGESYLFEWSSTTTGRIALHLVDVNLESLGSPGAFTWGVKDLPNSGSYEVTLPKNISGNYRLFITDGVDSGSSGVFYIFNRSQVASRPPVISEVSGPTSLHVNERGSWRVKASDPEKGPLSFSVLWGDGSTNQPNISSQTDTGDSVASFENHSYPLKHDYTVTFTATDDHGLSAQKAITVRVIP